MRRAGAASVQHAETIRDSIALLGFTIMAGDDDDAAACEEIGNCWLVRVAIRVVGGRPSIS